MDTVNSYPKNYIEKLKPAIEKHALITSDERKIASGSGTNVEDGWIFDFRNLFMHAEYLELIADIFWDTYEEKYPFQVGGQETGAIPLVTAIILKGKERSKPTNGFYIRKSRKLYDLQKFVEGTLSDDPVILTDDLLNTGGTIERQIEILQKANVTVSDVFSLLQFRSERNYGFIQRENIELFSLFSLDDFGLQLKERPSTRPPFTGSGFKVMWRFESKDPNLFYSVPKSAPVLDDERVYFGSDNGTFWALSQSEEKVVWKKKIWHTTVGKAIFSTPAIHDGIVYFGAYDGNLYALNTETGKTHWTFWEADWIGSSPCIAPEHNLLFIGLEFGLINKRGGIVALDLKTGEKRWEHTMTGLTHASPAYFAKENIVVIGCNNNYFYGFNAKTGKFLWEYETGGEIKASATFDTKRGYVFFGSFDGNLYVLEAKTGNPVGSFPTNERIYSTPLVHDDHLYVNSLDKHLYCIKLDDFSLKWKFPTWGRHFSSPVVIGDRIYIGSNDGIFYEIDFDGNRTDYFIAGERIPNRPAYNPKTKRFFLLTFANELYCIKKLTDT